MQFTAMETKLTIVAALAFALTASIPDANAGGPKTHNIKGSSSGSFVTTDFTFNNSASALSSVFTGNNNLGGPFNGQNVTQYRFLGSLVTPNCEYAGIPGFKFDLVQVDAVPIAGQIAYANGVLNYNQGQLFLLATSANGCMALTGLYTVSVDYDIVGGTGKFAGANGTLHSTIQGAVLAAPKPNGSWGQFGAFQEQHTGSATY